MFYYLFSWAEWVQATSQWHWRLVCRTTNTCEFKSSKWKTTWRRALCLLVYLNLLVGLGEELGVTPLSCDWNHWRRRKWNTEYTNRLNPQSVNESDLDQSEPSIQSLNPLIWILVERTSVFLLIHSDDLNCFLFCIYDLISLSLMKKGFCFTLF